MSERRDEFPYTLESRFRVQWAEPDGNRWRAIYGRSWFDLAKNVCREFFRSARSVSRADVKREVWAYRAARRILKSKAAA